jgi:hypothetical protein
MLETGSIGGFDYIINWCIRRRKLSLASTLPNGMIMKSSHPLHFKLGDAARRHDAIRQRPQDIIRCMMAEGDVENALKLVKEHSMEYADNVLRGEFGSMMIPMPSAA